MKLLCTNLLNFTSRLSTLPVFTPFRAIFKGSILVGGKYLLG